MASMASRIYTFKTKIIIINIENVEGLQLIILFIRIELKCGTGRGFGDPNQFHGETGYCYE